MQINEVILPKNNILGLNKIEMSRLSKLVVIAGKNGAGKSRLFENIQKLLESKPNKSEIDTIDKKIQNLKTSMYDYEKRASLEDKEIQRNHAKIIDLEKKLNNNISTKILSTIEQENIKKTEQELYNCKKTEKNRKDTKKSLELKIKKIKEDIEILNIGKEPNIKTDTPAEEYTFINFVPKKLKLQDCNNLTKNELLRFSNSLSNIKNKEIDKSVFAKIQHIQDAWFNATHQNTNLDNNEQDSIKLEYEKLKDNIETFLNIELKRDTDNNATLFNFPLGKTKLSDGQSILLQLCLSLYYQKADLKNIIIFMDEPENHLHPKALLDTFDLIQKVVSNGQIWVATHSIQLLSHVDPMSIWFMENGSIDHYGKIAHNVLPGLIGTENRINKLNDFMSLPMQMATNHFAYQCLFEPEAIETNNDDPQTTQIIEAINNKKNLKNKFKILDYGAGKGRLLSAIYELNKDKNIHTADWLDYIAYDLKSDSNKMCKNTISTVYGSSDKRFFIEENILENNCDSNSFDMIILCNVFHEIDPKEWGDLFGEQGMIRTMLKENGILLIVEDQLIPQGEKAYANGFLVFNEAQFRILFNVKSYKTLKTEKYKDRLVAHFIEKKHLTNYNKDNRIKAIEKQKTVSIQQIQQLRRKENPDYADGKLHGFWIQQLANSTLVLKELT